MILLMLVIGVVLLFISYGGILFIIFMGVVGIVLNILKYVKIN